MRKPSPFFFATAEVISVEICQVPLLDLHWGTAIIVRPKIVMKHFIAGLVICTAATGALAQGDVYVCVAANGSKEYRNTGETKGCKRLDISSGALIPAPERKAAPQASVSRPATSPADFPKVDSSTQKARDSDRRQILLDEMRAEEQKLAAQKKDYNNGEPERNGDERNYAKYQTRVANMKDELSRTEKNIDALRRELGNQK
jgi:hypothetical protein